MNIHGHLQIKQTRLVQVLCFLGEPQLVLKINRYKNLLGDRFAILDLYNYVPSNRPSWTISEIPFVAYDHDFARLLACNHRTRHPCLPSHKFYKYNSLRSFDKHIQAATSFCVLLVTIIRFAAVLNPSSLQLKSRPEPF